MVKGARRGRSSGPGDAWRNLLLLGGWFLCHRLLGNGFLFSQQHIQIIRVVREVALRSLARSAQVKVHTAVVRHAESNDIVLHALCDLPA